MIGELVPPCFLSVSTFRLEGGAVAAMRDQKLETRIICGLALTADGSRFHYMFEFLGLPWSDIELKPKL